MIKYIQYNFLYLPVFSKTPFVFPNCLPVTCCIRTIWVWAPVLLTCWPALMSVCGVGRAPSHTADTLEQRVWALHYARTVLIFWF